MSENHYTNIPGVKALIQKAQSRFGGHRVTVERLGEHSIRLTRNGETFELTDAMVENIPEGDAGGMYIAEWVMDSLWPSKVLN